MESEKCIDNQLSEISYSESIIDEESRQKLKLGIIKIHKPISYYVVGYFAYVMALIPFAYLVTFIDEIDTGSTYFAKLYERDTFYTTHFSFGKLFYWIVLNVVGFSFVVVVNLGNYRKDPFTSNDGSHKDIKILFPVSFFLFFMSSMVFLRDKYDMERNCPTISQEFLGNAYEKGIIQNSSFQLNSYEIVQSPSQVNETVLVVLLINIAQLFELNGQTECHIYDRMEVFKYNCFYLIVFFIGLNFTHLDNPPFNNITLEWDIMKNWPWYLWMIFAGIVSFIFINIGFLFKLYIYIFWGCN